MKSKTRVANRGKLLEVGVGVKIKSIAGNGDLLDK